MYVVIGIGSVEPTHGCTPFSRYDWFSPSTYYSVRYPTWHLPDVVTVLREVGQLELGMMLDHMCSAYETMSLLNPCCCLTHLGASESGVLTCADPIREVRASTLTIRRGQPCSQAPEVYTRMHVKRACNSTFNYIKLAWLTLNNNTV